MEISATKPVPFHGLIVAAGQGSRFGETLPKQYKSLSGKPLLRWCAEAFLATPGLQSLTVVISPGHGAMYDEAVKGLPLNPPVQGGPDRSISVFNGLNTIGSVTNDSIVLVHDAARPFVTSRDIARVACEAHESGAASLASLVTDTLRRGDNSYVERDNLWALQTPQGFRYGLLLQAHKRAGGSVTDDTGLVAALGHAVTMVPGSRRNIKITAPEDWDFAESIMGRQTETRTGTGFDVHAFSRDKPGTIRLCGIDIPHEHGLEGHSDADVGLHALTDALLGAMALGDIGQHFPPSDIQWKNASSDRFLKHAVDLVAARGGRIVNLDLTLVCEAPKIGPHRGAMQAKIATICGIEPARISVKATTTEKLGFTGRREGIAGQAAASVELPYRPA